MCRRTALLGTAVAAFGAGLIFSTLISGILLRILIGAVLLVVGLLLINRH